MIKKLIVNADDFGLSEGVCLGILKAHRDGIFNFNNLYDEYGKY